MNLKQLVTSTVKNKEEGMHACLLALSSLIHFHNPGPWPRGCCCLQWTVKTIPHRHNHRPTQCRQSVIQNLLQAILCCEKFSLNISLSKHPSNDCSLLITLSANLREQRMSRSTCSLGFQSSSNQNYPAYSQNLADS